MELVEWILPKLDPEFTFIVESVKEMGNCHGLTYPQEKCIKIREDVYVNALNGMGRDRFTIAHELGHYLLHQPKNVGLARIEKNEKIEPYKDPEWQANTFAAELLMPVTLINKNDDVNHISKKFGVSYQAARVRYAKMSN